MQPALCPAPCASFRFQFKTRTERALSVTPTIRRTSPALEGSDTPLPRGCVNRRSCKTDVWTGSSYPPISRVLSVQDELEASSLDPRSFHLSGPVRDITGTRGARRDRQCGLQIRGGTASSDKHHNQLDLPPPKPEPSAVAYRVSACLLYSTSSEAASTVSCDSPRSL